jgi:hypothetical protein
MTLEELKTIESEQMELLRKRSIQGDNHAAEIVLNYLRSVSKDISDWRRLQDVKKPKKDNPFQT